MTTYSLGEIAPIAQGIVPKQDNYWLLNLDMVESNTGRVLDYVCVDREEIGASTIAFDTNNVLYSKLRPYLNKVVSPEKAGYATSEMLPLRPDTEIITREYLTFFLRSPRFVEYINDKTSGAKMPRANISDLKAVKIDCPSIPIQNQITDTFDKLCRIIDIRQQELSMFDDLIKARFVEMFGDIEEDVPLSFYIKSLTAGKSLAGEEECKNKVLKTGAATYDYFDPTQVKNLPTDYEPLAEHQIHDGDIIISRMNTAELVGAAAYIWKAPNNTFLPDRLWRAELNEAVNPVFVWQSIIQPSTKEAIRKIAGGTSGSMKNISKPGLLEVKVKKADYEAQNCFAEFVTQVFKSKAAVQKALDETQLLFDSLMQKYFG